MIDKKILKVEKREVLGKKVKKLRRMGILPGNIYGRKFKSQAIQLPLKDFLDVYREKGETSLVYLKLNNEVIPSLIHNVQKDPVDQSLIHVDFLKVDLREKVKSLVPIELVGESPAQKQGKGTIVQYINEVEVEALPQDLPEKIIVDLGQLTEVDQVVLLKDLALDRRAVEVKGDPDQILVKVEPPRKEEVVEVKEEEVQVPQEGPEGIGEETPKEEPKA